MPGAPADGFPTFGPAHLAALAITAAVAAGLPLLARAARRPSLTRAVAWAIALILLANDLIYYIHGLAAVSLYEFVRDKLPLHICGVAVYLVAGVLLASRGRRVFEVAYFWGLGGAVQALLTPNLQDAFPSCRFFQFFLTHGLIVVGVLYAVVAMGMCPARGAVWRVFLISNAYMLLTAGFNALVGSNYLFLREPPLGESPFFFLPWPWYILFLEAVGLVMLILLDLPFALRRRGFAARCL